MTLSNVQSTSAPSNWWRWDKWRGRWQTELKLRRCLMSRTRQTAESLRTAIVSVLVYCHSPAIGPWDLVSSSGSSRLVTHRVSHLGGLSVCLWFCPWFEHIVPSTSDKNWFFSFLFSTNDHGQSHQWLLMPCDVLSITACSSITMKPFNMCIPSQLTFQPDGFFNKLTTAVKHSL